MSASTGASLGCFQANGDIVGTDLVASGAVFIATDTSLSAWNTTTSARIWQVATQHYQQLFGAGIGAVYTGPTDGQDGYLHAYQASNGAPLWSALVGPVIPSFASLPTSLGATLYVGTTDGAVVALRASDGAIMWRTMLQ
jgi:outer membrane protein assembly factor BamB